MKYEYAYKTPDGVRHTEVMDAPSREVVFESLRAKGIKAIKVVATDGSKANGEVRVMGVKKRVAFALVIGAIIISAGVTWWTAETGVSETSSPDSQGKEPSESIVSATTNSRRIAAPLPRQTIQGDRRRIENVPTNLFASVAETYLSRFAEPGRDFGSVTAAFLATNNTELLQMLNAPIYVSEDELTEYIDLKRITAGIKREMRNYLRGGGTQEEYLQELVQRQKQEMSYRDKADKKLQRMIADNEPEQAIYDYWIKANAQLQSMGIYPLPMPDALRNSQITLDFD